MGEIGKMLQRAKKFKQDKGFATNVVLDKPEPQLGSVGTIRKPDF